MNINLDKLNNTKVILGILAIILIIGFVVGIYSARILSKSDPEISYFALNSGTPENEFQLPLYSWTPSIAISQGLEYNGDEFEYFNNDLILGSLKGSSLFRLKLDKNNVVRNIEKIYISERIRDIIQINNGKLLIYADSGNLLLISKAKIK